MNLNMKVKDLTNKQLTKLFFAYEERFEAIATTLETMALKQPDFAGAQILNIFTEENVHFSFFMVTDFCIQESHINFYHLVNSNMEQTKHTSFEPKPPKMKTGAYIKKLERDPKWNKCFEQFFIPSVVRTQFIGRFTYSKHIDLDDTDFNLLIPKGEVVNFPSNDDDAK